MAAIPTPEAGLVVAYAYLWRREHRAGQDEGLKDRPTVIVLAVERERDGATMVTVLPITHSAPASVGDAVEIPAAVKRHLGLDDQRSWVVVAEGNEFVWSTFTRTANTRRFLTSSDFSAEPASRSQNPSARPLTAVAMSTVTRPSWSDQLLALAMSSARWQAGE
ncbi:MAG TPA: hypothetical protein VF459_18105 [Caulobacteraceae bacterium]